MYKVMIVDDEERIVEGLTKIVPWERFNCQVCATAYDVSASIKLINSKRPDILFSDINMPDGNGLTMLAALRSEHPNMQVSVLTGYRDFEYAQRAIRLGVVRYLLKPSKMAEIEEALEVMTQNLKLIAAKQNTAQAAQSSDNVVNDKPAQPTGKNEQLEKQAAEETLEAEGGQDEATCFLIEQAQEYIALHCCEKIGLNDVAENCFVSQWHLSKLLNRYTGKSFYDLLNCARIEKAKQLMQDPALRIGDIAEMLGYSDAPHFSRIFKKLEGVSANEYRNSHL